MAKTNAPKKPTPAAKSAPPAKVTAAPNAGKGGLLADKSGSAGATHPDAVMKNMNIPQQLMPGFIGAVKSGMQFVTDPRTHQYFLQQLGGPGPASQKLSEGVFALMQIIVHQAKGACPPQVIIPAGMYLISWCADYVKRAKLLPITDRDIADAMQMYLHDVITKTQAGIQQKGVLGGQMQPGQQGPQGGQQPPQPGPAMPKMKAAPQQAPGSNPTLGPGAAPGPQGQPMPGMGA